MKKFILFFIQNKITTLMLFLVIIFLGIISLSKLSIALTPHVEKKD